MYINPINKISFLKNKNTQIHSKIIVFKANNEKNKTEQSIHEKQARKLISNCIYTGIVTTILWLLAKVKGPKLLNRLRNIQTKVK